MTSKFTQAMNISKGVTWNNAKSLEYPDPKGICNGRMSLFFKTTRGLDIPRLYKYILDSSNENIIDTFLLVFNIRDCRGGKGERDVGRRSLIWLFINYPILFSKILVLIPEYGRWDDILHFFPSVLNLNNLDYVRDNFISQSINESDLNNLHDLQKNIVKMFGNQLLEDYNNMLEGKVCSIAAKWAPSEKDSLDRNHNVYKCLADSMNVTPRVLRKKFLTPLREYIKIVEKYMCSNRWDQIDYNKVPSCAMKRLKKSFEKHDSHRFNEWRDLLSKGDRKVAKVNAKQLFPYELIREIRINNMADTVCEEQWKVLEEECFKLGVLEDSIVVCDTSSSMHTPDYLPIDNSIALGLLISHCTKGVFNNHVITFNTIPEFITITPSCLYNRWLQLRDIPWGGSTNIQETFKIILDKAKRFNLSGDDMPKRIWIISDMQFNAVDGSSNTNFEVIDNMYKKSNYTRPQIIFWNVNGASTDFPITSDENGTCLISGFSPSIMKSILSNNDMSPYNIMRNTIDGDRLSKVRECLK